MPRFGGALTTTYHYYLDFTEVICTVVYISVHAMPHMDTSAGVTDSSTDYSDFRFQQANLDVVKLDTGNTNLTGFYDFEPLEPVGGLANNEVAELVYLETQVGMEFEQESDDQDVGSSTEVRGTVGSNLSNDAGSLVANGGINVDGELSDDSLGDLDGNTLADNRIFQMFRVEGSPAFDDEANGTGGGGSAPQQVYEKHFRDLTGRGPVLDQTDDMSATIRIVTGDSVITERANVRLHMYWDVAEVSDAGREFSLP